MNLLSGHIIEFNIDGGSNRLKFLVDNGIQVYIRYNNYGEYTYVIQFSLEKFDQIRYDNFDDTWVVPTRPHHCHLRHNKDVVDSPFVGEPETDIPILSDIILKFINI